MSIKSMYADNRQEILDMYASGMTYQAMINQLQSEGIPAKMYSLWSYCQRLQHPKFTPAPHCADCDQRMVVDSAERSGGHIYISVWRRKRRSVDLVRQARSGVGREERNEQIKRRKE